MLEHTPRVC